MQDPATIPDPPRRVAPLRAQAARAYRQVTRLADEQGVTKCAELLRQLAGEYAGVVDAECRRCRNRLPWHLEFEDMVQEARVAFVAALNRYDPEHDASFGLFVRLRVRGAILDWLRREGGLQGKKAALAREIGPTCRLLTRSLGRAPDMGELASALGVTTEVLDQVLETCEPLVLTPIPLHESADPASEAEHRELVSRVARALTLLPDTERTVIELHYFDELSLREAATVLGMDRNRVRRRHQEALLRLRSELGDLAPSTGAPPPKLVLLLAALFALPAMA